MPTRSRPLGVAAVLLAAVSWLVAPPQDADACSRVLHTSRDGRHVVTGRSMDWFEDIQTNLWAFPRGMAREGAAGPNSAAWTSRYGSIIAAGFDVGTADGLNEKGLVVNMLYLGEADFGPRDASRPGLSWSVYAQYLLDNFATVAEAVGAMQGDRFQVVGSALPGSSSKPPTLHWALSDATGDSAVFEYLEGKLRIHHGRQYTVMTNSPPYDQQLALNAYWESVGGDAMLPGTRRAADRFVRASHYVKQLPDPASDHEALANVRSVMHNVSVPLGIGDPEKPNIAATIWRTAADHVQRVYYFDSVYAPGALWVRLDGLDLSEGSSVRKLTMAGRHDLTGDQTDAFQPAAPFAFTGVDSHTTDGD